MRRTQNDNRKEMEVHVNFQSDDATHQRVSARDADFQDRPDRRLRCSTPNMGVILWGASPLYLVPETFTRSQYNK